MVRLRVLSLLALTVAVLVFLYSKAEFYALVIPGNSPIVMWGLTLLILIGASAVSVVSSVVLIFLSFFAIKLEADGAFVVNDDSFYGFVFMWIAKMDYSGQTKSFCKVFWQTNLTLFCTGIVLGLAVLVFFYGLPFLYSLGIAAIWDFVKPVLLVLLFVVVCIVAAMAFSCGVIAASRTLAGTQFGGVTFKNFYHHYLCPRIRIK